MYYKPVFSRLSSKDHNNSPEHKIYFSIIAGILPNKKKLFRDCENGPIVLYAIYNIIKMLTLGLILEYEHTLFQYFYCTVS